MEDRVIYSEAGGAQGGRIAAIQLLRALAALAVVVGHIAFAFADHLPGGLGLAPESDGRAGQVAVMLFFVLSGYVMVISSQGLFGRAHARRIFWWRRLVRVMPPYWIATGLLAAIFLTLFPQPIDPLRLGQSLLLIPYWPADGALRALPFLWVGWTLFFEMLFYALFGLFVGLRREAAVGATLAVLALLAGAGVVGGAIKCAAVYCYPPGDAGVCCGHAAGAVARAGRHGARMAEGAGIACRIRRHPAR